VTNSNKSKEDLKIICRCEDVAEDEIIEAIREGYTDFEELRRKLRIGMGPCQGRTCFPLVRRILISETRKNAQEINLPTSRPPVIPVSLGVFASKDKGYIEKDKYRESEQ
jgi:NAD(P)H-nitrite reductase large subunit